ncbi:LOW QUALITY PROTEIN: leucine-rich repeat-containing G-protein coupled receptor 5-like, partial [Scomber scombrus]
METHSQMQVVRRLMGQVQRFIVEPTDDGEDELVLCSAGSEQTCCAFVSCERRGGGGGGGGGGSSSWEREEAADPSGRDNTFASSQVDQDWEDFLLEFEDEPKPQHSVHCSPAP